MEQLRNIFLEADEHQITVLGNRYLQLFLRTGKEEGSFCIVSNYRLYLKGLFYRKTGMRYRRCKESQIVELSQIGDCSLVQGRRWSRDIQMMEFACTGQVLAVPVNICTEYECSEFQKHIRMAIAYERRK